MTNDIFAIDANYSKNHQNSSLLNDFIFFSSKLTTTEIIVYQVFENPDESIDNYYKRLGYAFDDNTAFPYPTDLVSDITNLILKGEINPDNV